MADTIQYGMGQIRYNNSSNYMSNCNFTYNPVSVLVSSENESDVYQDIILKSNNSDFSFDPNTAYLLKIKIPKDLNYNSTYRIKLISTTDSSNTILNPDTVTYQMIKYINVPKETNSSTSSQVIIYPVDRNGELWVQGDYIVKSAIVITDLNTEIHPGDVYFENGKYYIAGNSESEKQEISNKSEIILNHNWITGHSSSNVEFNFILTPRSSDETYNQIWIEMFRESYDQDIYSDGFYGRKIDLESGLFEVEVYELSNLIDDISGVDTLTHIGVYSHPNTIMAINGEEIRVGQSGYYELNNFEITSFGIAANDNKDRFIVDYQYQIITQ